MGGQEPPALEGLGSFSSVSYNLNCVGRHLQQSTLPMIPNYHPIDYLPGLTKKEENQLKTCGIFTTKDLLQKTGNLQAKQSLAEQLQVNLRIINKWVALADLARIPSVGYQYSGVLLHCGVACVSQLTEMSVSQLHRQILRLHVATLQKKTLCPQVKMVQQWIIEGRSLREE